MTNVPSGYVSLIQSMSAATGIPYAVIAAQANEESGFNPTAVSPTGAEGWLQFEPSTYNSVAGQAGVSPGTEFNPADEAKAYDVYMGQLLRQEGGNLQKALEAYNAGPGNLAAGASYANTILAAAGTGNTTINGSGSATPSVSTASVVSDPFTGIITDVVDAILKMLGLSSLKDLVQRLGLIIFGAILIIVAIHMIGSSRGKQAINVSVDKATNSSGESTRTQTVKTPVGAHRSRVATGAGRELEEAAVA